MKSAKQNRLPLILLGVFLAMILAGILLGEPGTVFRKAVKICLECIGIG